MPSDTPTPLIHTVEEARCPQCDSLIPHGAVAKTHEPDLSTGCLRQTAIAWCSHCARGWEETRLIRAGIAEIEYSGPLRDLRRIGDLKSRADQVAGIEHRGRKAV